jgi:predicted NUDIX family phosphoesterase
MKGHFFFNAWTTATMLAEVLETQESNADLLLLDRGFFDALVWLELQFRRDQVTEDEKRVFADFVLLKRWRSLVDTTIIMTAEPTKALAREHQNQIVPRTGSLMNPNSLREFNDALDTVASQYSDKFSIVQIDTTAAHSAVETNKGLLTDLLSRIDAWADPDIAVVPREVVLSLFRENAFLQDSEADDALTQLSSSVTYRKRSIVETTADFVQFIGAGVLARDERIVVFQRDISDVKTASYGRRKLWIGAHVDRRDSILSAAISCLRARVQQDLHLSSVPEPEFLGLAWNEEQAENRHLGIIFRVPVANDYIAKHLENKQFKKMARSSHLRSLFMTQEEILKDLSQLDLEPWSEYMIRNINLANSNLKVQ